MTFDAPKFSDLLTEVQGKRSLNEYARNSGVSAAYISRLKNAQKGAPPSVKIIARLANDYPMYISMMKAAGYKQMEEFRDMPDHLTLVSENRLRELLEKEKELEKLNKFHTYFSELYGINLEVANWHQNGDLESFDNFFDSAEQEMEE